jgi:hypothetical protein
LRLDSPGALPTLTNCTVTSNSAGSDGGGLFVDGDLALLTLNNCTVNGNTASRNGGGLSIGDDPSIHARTTAMLSNCTISGNQADGTFAGLGGGGLFIANFCTATLASCTVSGNSAGGNGFGGGLDVFTGFDGAAGTATLTNCTVSGNFAGIGGGLSIGGSSGGPGGTATLTNCTVSGNSASFGGGLDIEGDLVLFSPATANLNNTIVAAQTAGGDIRINAAAATFASGNNNLIGDGSGNISGSNNLLGTADNPIDPLLAPLGNYGGPTQTMALLPGSPAIDTGASALLPTGVSTDQRGYPRSSGAAVDIGAFEVTDADRSVVTVSSPSVTYGGTATVTLQAEDNLGNNLTSGGLNVAFGLGAGTSGGTLGPVTDNGNGTYTATFTATAAGTPVTITATINGMAVTTTLPTVTVTKADLYVSATANSKTYGQTASDTGTLSGVVPGDVITASFSSAGDAASAPVGTGSYPITATLSDPNNKLGNYTVHETDAILTVSPATPTVSVNPVNLIYGTALANSQLSGTATWTVGGSPVIVAGTFTYTSAAGTILSAGSGQSEAVTFTPTDATDYKTASATASVNVVQAATTSSTVSLSSATAVFGQPVTLTATVSNTQTAVTPSGSVGFYSGSTELGAAPVGAGGVATLTVSSLGRGKHTITASFSDPAVNFAPSGSPSGVSLTITQASTTTALTTTTTTAVFSQAVTFTATVATVAPSAATPTGSITFMDGSTVLQTVRLSGGSASLTTSLLAVGSHSITATYNGTSNFGASGPAASAVSVSPDATTAVVTSSVSNAVYGQAVTIKAVVKASAPGSGKPTGTVSFYDGTTLLGTATLSNGVAKLKTTALSVGTNSITVVYDGDGNFLSTTSAAQAITVKQDPTTWTLTSSSATAAQGTPVTFSATVLPATPGSGTPTGTVSFWDGSTLLGTVNLSGGVAQLTYAFTVIGEHKIKAVYNGDADFLPGTSAVLTETIT